jgi:hypothetical protein
MKRTVWITIGILVAIIIILCFVYPWTIALLTIGSILTLLIFKNG